MVGKGTWCEMVVEDVDANLFGYGNVGDGGGAPAIVVVAAAWPSPRGDGRVKLRPVLA
jgi:hypothetical protein